MNNTAVPEPPPPETITGYVERIDIDSLSGWAVSSTGAPLRFALALEDVDVFFHLSRQEREDVRSAHPDSDPCSGFLLKAVDPGGDWLQALRGGQLALRVNGQSVPLADPVSAAPVPAACPERPSITSQAPGADTLRQWEALRRVNACLERGAGLAEAARVVSINMQLEPPEFDRLMFSLVPRFCDAAVGASVRGLGDVALVPPGGPQEAHNAWGAGLALLGLCQTGQFRPAIRLLRRMATMLDGPDWLPTECLHQAMRAVAAGADSISPEVLRLLAHGLLNLARAQQGQWFSRLHDRHLIAALVIVLGLALRSDDPAFRAATLRALLRSHGLCPGFWEQADPWVECSEELRRARQNWRCIAASVARAPAGGLLQPGVKAALGWFAAIGNPEVAQFERELATHDSNVLQATLAPSRLRPSYARHDEEHCAGEICPAGGAPLPLQGLLVVCVIRNEELLLPHFLQHYRALGAPHFVFVDNGSTDGSLGLLLDQPDITVFTAAAAYREAGFGVAWQQAVLGCCCLGRWVLVVDADEFLVFDNCESLSLPLFIHQIESAGFDAVFTDLVDMYPAGSLDEADLSRSSPFDAAPCFDAPALRRWHLGGGRYSNAPSYVSALRHRLAPDAEPNAFLSQKCTLFRYAPWVRLGHGLHDVANLNPAPVRVWLAHFKYHAAFARKVRDEVERAQHFDGAREYRHYARMLESNTGFWCEGVSVRYEDSSSLRARGMKP